VRFPRVQRRYAGIPEEVSAVLAFDAQAAWREFDALLFSLSPGAGRGLG
jgi:hypothetical protein